MANMSLEKNKMPEQEPDVRSRNFKEVALGYTKEIAIDEAARCLNCKNSPCVNACPVNVKIPEFIKCITEEKFDEAYDVITSTNSLPAICGRVCPQESQCESKCVRGIKGEPVAIGRLERFVADYAMNKGNAAIEKPETNAHKVAVVGSGPSGLTCASDLAKRGYDVTVFEALHKAGGVLVYGIPEFRLPKALVQSEIDKLTELGVDIKLNTVIGKAITVDELLTEEGYEAVYVASGAGLPKFQGIPGENSLCVYSANEFLTRINLMKAYKFPEYATPVKTGDKVAVVGGGNVAMDAARCAKRMGAEAYVIYRRSEEEMPARAEEIHHAKQEGIDFRLLNNPTRILADEKGFVKAIECIKMELGEPDESGRRRPVEIKGSEYTLDVQTVIIAIGNSPNPLILSTTPKLQSSKWGGIIADEETGATSEEGVYAGGDAVTGAATVILAMGAGKKAAEAIDKYIKTK